MRNTGTIAVLVSLLSIIALSGCCTPCERHSEGVYEIKLAGLEQLKPDDPKASAISAGWARIEGVKGTRIEREKGSAVVEIAAGKAVSLADLERALPGLRIDQAAPLDGTLRIAVDGPAGSGGNAVEKKLKQFRSVSLVTFLYDDDRKPSRIEACEVAIGCKDDVSLEAIRASFSSETNVKLLDIALLGPQAPRRPRAFEPER